MIDSEYAHKILIVDDLEEEIFLIKEQLNMEISNIKVIGISDPTKAEETVIKEKVDLVLLDIQMPILTGFEVARILKNNESTKLLPIVFITAEYNRQDFIEKGFDIGAIDYMEKPLDSKQMINKIKLYLKIFDREKELRKREALYRAVVEDQTELIFRFNENMEITFLNKAASRFINKTKEEVLGKSIGDFRSLLHLSSIDLQDIRNNINSLSEKNYIFTFETISEMPDKTKHWIKWTNRKIYDEQNHFIEFQSVGMDITEIRKKEKQLKISEERFRELFNHMSSEVSILQANEDGNKFIYKDYNKLNKINSHLNKDYIKGKDFDSVLPENRKGNMKELLKKVWKTGETQNFFISSYDENDEINYWKEGYIYKLPSGEIVSIKNDLTERKKMEEELLKSDIKHWFLLDSIDTPVLAIKNNFDISYCNEAYATHMGKSTLELKNKNLLQVFPFIKDHPSFNAYREVIKTKIQKEIEYKDNNKYYSEYVYKTPWGVISVIKDITDKKESELEIKKLYFSIEQSPNSIILTNNKGNIEYVNQAFTSIIGLNRHDLKNKNIDYVYSDDKYKDFITKINTAVEKGIDFKYEIKTLDKNRNPIWQSVILSPIKNEQGLISHYLIIMEDITARKRFEVKIKSINEELEQRVLMRTQELNKANYELDSKNKQLDQRNKTIEYDLKLAQKVQQQILVKSLPSHIKVDYSTFYEPMDMVGGDFFDFIIRREGDIGILICDVSGHGSAAGFITAMLKIITSTSRKYAHIPSMFLKNVNYSIYNKIAENFVTAFYGVISTDTKKFTYANAGHTFPILFRKEDSYIHRLVAKGGVLGVTNDLNFEQHEIDLYKGDRLFLYTDGVTETINDKRESYGRKRLYGFIKDNKDKDINLLVSQLFENIKTFRQSNKTDDMAFVGLEIK